MNMEMNNKAECIFISVAVFFVLLSVMVSPLISAAVAVLFLVILAVYKLYRSKNETIKKRKGGI